jgi:hypothetical protein
LTSPLSSAPSRAAGYFCTSHGAYATTRDSISIFDRAGSYSRMRRILRSSDVYPWSTCRAPTVLFSPSPFWTFFLLVPSFEVDPSGVQRSSTNRTSWQLLYLVRGRFALCCSKAHRLLVPRWPTAAPVIGCKRSIREAFPPRRVKFTNSMVLGHTSQC